MLTRQEIRTRVGLNDGRVWFYRNDGRLFDTFDARDYEGRPAYRRVSREEVLNILDGRLPQSATPEPVETPKPVAEPQDHRAPKATRPEKVRTAKAEKSKPADKSAQGFAAPPTRAAVDFGDAEDL
jgi:hypothetical protein